jgi:hypothetical protein
MIYLLLLLTLQGQVVKSVSAATLEDCVQVAAEINDDAGSKLKAACFVKHTGEPS